MYMCVYIYNTYGRRNIFCIECLNVTHTIMYV